MGYGNKAISLLQIQQAVKLITSALVVAFILACFIKFKKLAFNFQKNYSCTLPFLRRQSWHQASQSRAVPYPSAAERGSHTTPQDKTQRLPEHRLWPVRVLWNTCINALLNCSSLKSSDTIWENWYHIFHTDGFQGGWDWGAEVPTGAYAGGLDRGGMSPCGSTASS